MDVLILRTLSKHITQPQQMINLVPYTREKKYTTKESCLGVKYIKTLKCIQLMVDYQNIFLKVIIRVLLSDKVPKLDYSFFINNEFKAYAYSIC